MLALDAGGHEGRLAGLLSEPLGEFEQRIVNVAAGPGEALHRDTRTRDDRLSDVAGIVPDAKGLFGRRQYLVDLGRLDLLGRDLLQDFVYSAHLGGCCCWFCLMMSMI